MTVSNYTKKELLMISIDGSYLYDLGGSISPIGDLNGKSTNMEAYLICYKALDMLHGFLNNSVYTSSIRILTEPAKTS